ncbi:MAG: FAD-binding oxidoreductase [Endomicrobium sp.]|jgi:D-lactate dehydrogenase (cytochrome)|nr:FAD-binding oxidoreductase [Endomicrobium sp.]
MIIKKDKSTIQNYFQDNSGVSGAYADSVAIAENEDDISNFLIEMSEKQIPVTIVGALTGNTASGLAFGGVVLSLENLNNIGEIKENSDNTAFITVGAGARLNDIKVKAYQNGWMYPPDPTEKSAFIGGNIATNASGSRGFKFGPTRDYVQALKVIFSDGSKSFIQRGKIFSDKNGNITFDTNKGTKHIKLPEYKLPHIKNAAGYYNYPDCDLIDVFIGSEGTLCVIVEAVLKLVPCFKEVFGGIIFFQNRDNAFMFVDKIKLISKKAKVERLRNSINAMSLEYFDKNALDLIRDDYPLIPLDAECGIMFEQDVYDDSIDLLIDKWYKIMQKYNVNDDKVWFASNLAELEKFRIFRHAIPEHINKIVKKNKVPKVGTDFAVPEGKLSDIVDFCQKEFKNSGIFNLTFGHIGENHLHANILASNEDEYEKCRKLYIDICSQVVKLKGTVSAEHGIGKLRHIFLEKMFGKEGFKEMAKFKKSFDKSAILCQDNIFPRDYLYEKVCH